MLLFIFQFTQSLVSRSISDISAIKQTFYLEFEFHGVASSQCCSMLNNKETLCTRKTTRVRDMYSRHQRGTSPRDICRVESAPSMWSGGVKIQIENHLANLPVVPSVNKFRFTRVGGLRVMDPCARAEKRGALTCIKGGRAYLRFLYTYGIPAEYSQVSKRIFLSLDRAETRVRNIRSCNLLNRR